MTSVRDFRLEGGAALIIAVMCTLLLAALGAALVLTTGSETMIAANYRNSVEGMYAAEAALERAMGEVLTVADWNQLLNGSVRSGFIDGAPSGPRTLADGATIDLGEVTNAVNCGKVTACSDADMNDPNQPGRPWGTNNPRWQLYAYGRLADMLAGTINSPFYVIVFVADDPSETDGDPLHDGAAPDTNPGSGVIALRAGAFGPRGSHKSLEVTVARGQDYNNGVGQAGFRMLSWREVQ